MKLLLGLTDLWRFPITGEETWAGVGGLCALNPVTGKFQFARRSDHVTSTQQSSRFAQGRT
jgi:hypothetical protein